MYDRHLLGLVCLFCQRVGICKIPNSVPRHENSLALQCILNLNDTLSEVLTVVRYLSPHVVDEEWL